MRMRARLAVFVLCVAAASPLAPASGAARPPRATQAFYWRWTDGAESATRTFAESRYRVPDRLPRLRVSAYPASPRQRVRLEFRRGGAWVLEDSGMTSQDGSVTLDLNPYGENGAWGERTDTYRLAVADVTTSLTVTYRR